MLLTSDASPGRCLTRRCAGCEKPPALALEEERQPVSMGEPGHTDKSAHAPVSSTGEQRHSGKLSVVSHNILAKVRLGGTASPGAPVACVSPKGKE